MGTCVHEVMINVRFLVAGLACPLLFATCELISECEHASKGGLDCYLALSHNIERACKFARSINPSSLQVKI